MEFTTHFGLHSQASRLSGATLSRTVSQVKDGALTLFGNPIPRTDFYLGLHKFAPIDYNSEDFRLELFPVHSPLLGESWLVSFPPLSDMLKFSG